MSLIHLIERNIDTDRVQLHTFFCEVRINRQDDLLPHLPRLFKCVRFVGDKSIAAFLHRFRSTVWSAVREDAILYAELRAAGFDNPQEDDWTARDPTEPHDWPARMLDQALALDALSAKDVRRYLLEESDEYSYYLQVNEAQPLPDLESESTMTQVD